MFEMISRGLWLCSKNNNEVNQLCQIMMHADSPIAHLDAGAPTRPDTLSSIDKDHWNDRHIMFGLYRYTILVLNNMK